MVTVFEQGDIVFMDFDPQSGHEQKGRRPAIVVSNDTFNRISNMTMVCPITNTDSNHPLHVQLNEQTKTSGFVMCNQVRMLDLESRNATYREKAPAEITSEVVDIIISIVEIK